MEECTNVKGAGLEGLGMSGGTGELHLVHKAFSLLSCSLEDLAAWSSPPPPPPAASATTIATQIPVLRSQLHRSHNLGCPFLLPHHTAPPRRPAITAHAPPERQQLFPLHARAQTHKHWTRTHRLVGTCLFSSSPFPFSHIIQFLPLLFTLRKIPWPHDPMKA